MGYSIGKFHNEVEDRVQRLGLRFLATRLL